MPSWPWLSSRPRKRRVTFTLSPSPMNSMTFFILVS